jgi:hypothetical protein
MSSSVRRAAAKCAAAISTGWRSSTEAEHARLVLRQLLIEPERPALEGIGDMEPAALARLREPVGLHPRDRFAHYRAADPQLAAEHPFGRKLRARRKCPPEDRALEPGGDSGRQIRPVAFGLAGFGLQHRLSGRLLIPYNPPQEICGRNAIFRPEGRDCQTTSPQL